MQNALAIYYINKYTGILYHFPRSLKYYVSTLVMFHVCKRKVENNKPFEAGLTKGFGTFRWKAE